MGNIFAKRRSRSVSASENLSNGHYGGVESNYCKSNYDINSVSTTKKLVSPFVYQRLSSMFVDEDGDVANEFYYEVPAEKSKNQPFLIKKNPLLLKAQGFVDYDIPRLHPSFPYIMVEVGCIPS